MDDTPSWQRFPQHVAAFKYRRSVLRGTPYERIVMAVRNPGQQWRDVNGKRITAEDAQRKLLERGYVFVHRSREPRGSIRVVTELWLPRHLADRES